MKRTRSMAPLNSPGLAFIERVFSTSSGCVIVVAIAPWHKSVQFKKNIWRDFLNFGVFYRSEAAGEVGDEVVLEVVGEREQRQLDLVVEAELPDSHQDLHNNNKVSLGYQLYTNAGLVGLAVGAHRTAGRPIRPVEQFCDSLLSRHARHPVQRVLVTAMQLCNTAPHHPSGSDNILLFPLLIVTYFLRCSGGSFISFCMRTLTMSPGVPTNPPQAPAQAAIASRLVKGIGSPLGDTRCLATSYIANLGRKCLLDYDSIMIRGSGRPTWWLSR